MEAVTDLQETLQALIAQGTSPLEIVVIEEAPDYPGELVFQPFEGEQSFYSRYREWVSRYLVLSEVYNLPAFIDHLNAEGWVAVLGPSCEPILKDYERFSEPLKIEGYELHPFQQFSLQRAFETDFWYYNWATGAGKSFVCAAGAKELFARGQIDLVIACTMTESKIDLCRFFTKAGIDAVINDGLKPKRTKGYAAGHQAYIANYEKLWVDGTAIGELATDKRVLWVFDETHRLLSDLTNGSVYNNARKAFMGHLQRCAPGTKVWPMSASVVDGNPLRFRDVFSLDGSPNNPLGSQAQFQARYADSIKTIPLKRQRGRPFDLTVFDWNSSRLQEVRHRVGGRTQAVRKSDPGVAPLFKGLQTIVVPIQASKHEHELADILIDRAYRDWRANPDLDLSPYYTMLRYAANTALALRRTHFEVGQQIAAEHSDLIDKITNTKLAKLNEQLESIRESGDKVLVFTHWTNLGLLLIAPDITVPHVVHYGTGQSAAASQEAREQFWNDPDITCFLTSDAGAHGLNMQCARYVIQLEPTYSFDLGMQRSSRIDRADSHLDGLTNYVYVTENSVEERVWTCNNGRRMLSAAVQGTAEHQSYEAMTGRPWTPQEAERARQAEADNTRWLMFGDRR